MLVELGARAMTDVALDWDGQVVGHIHIGSSDPGDATLAKRASAVREFAVVCAALIGPALVERARLEALRASIEAIIANRAFRPVFQPIVEIGSGRVVGYEALTRFADGTRPDRRFRDADAAGVGSALETACLTAAMREAIRLPAGGWLGLNVSPAFAADVASLLEVVAESPREIVLEITEHVEVDDYERLALALRSLPGNVRISIDDAGVGYAGLKHILELSPHFVKLDIALVRSIDADPARRAMVAAMTRFAAETGTLLIAEGIESEPELAALAELGVTLGQGFLLGRPEPIDTAARGHVRGAAATV